MSWIKPLPRREDDDDDVSKNSSADTTYAAYDISTEFDIRAELGHGGFSAVYEAHSKSKDKHRAPTALKITPIKTLKEKLGVKSLDDYVAKSDRLQRLNEMASSGHIIRYYGVRLSKDDLFQFYSLCQGGDMFSRLTESPSGHFTEDEAKRATRNLVVALAEVHEFGLIHRDIKPENCLFAFPDDDPGDVILADFGMVLEDAYPGVKFMGHAGTPGYMAPEMAANRPYDAAVDIFSLGVTTYEMLTGRSPFLSESPEDYIVEVLSRQIPYPKRYWSEISMVAKSCVRCMLEKDPNLRWSAEELLEHPWFDTLTEEERRLPYDLYELRPLLGLPRRERLKIKRPSPAIEADGSTTKAEEEEPPPDRVARMTHISTRASSMRKRQTSAPEIDDTAGDVQSTKSILEGRASEEIRRKLQQL